MPHDTDSDILLTHFEWTVERLAEILKQEPSEYFRDAALQRFGFTCEVAFKCLRPLAGGLDEPGSEFAWAAARGFFGKAQGWEGIVEDYREINQKPARERADAIYARLAGYLACFRAMLAGLKARQTGA